MSQVFSITEKRLNELHLKLFEFGKVENLSPSELCMVLMMTVKFLEEKLGLVVNEISETKYEEERN